MSFIKSDFLKREKSGKKESEGGGKSVRREDIISVRCGVNVDVVTFQETETTAL